MDAIKDTVNSALEKLNITGGASQGTPAKEPSEEQLNELKSKYQKAGQEQVFAFYDKLSPAEKATLYEQLSNFNPDYINEITERALHPAEAEATENKLEPLPENATSSVLSSQQEDLDKWYNSGLDLIAENQVAVVLMAGGQGTRLGSSAPKGCFDIGLPSKKSMAAPASKTIKDLSGKWLMNSSLSDSPEPALALQGIGWMTRKAIGMATLTLHATQYEAAPSPPGDEAGAPVWHVDIEQTATGGIKGTSEKRCVDDVPRDHKDWLFGHVKGQTRWITADEVTDEFLSAGWLESDDEKVGPNGESHLRNYVVSQDSGWTAEQIWGFKLVAGERRHVRNLVVKKGDQRVELVFVYDFLG